MNGSDIISELKKYLKANYHKTIKDATPIQVYNALSNATMEMLADRWDNSIKSHQNDRRACYFSAEFLVGRAIFNNLICLGVYDDVKWLLGEEGFQLDQLEEIEDAALGNGGLGRLAACFLDSAATLNLPLDGYGIRYKYGLFKQAIENGFQVEYPDDWTKYGDPWTLRCEEDSVRVEFEDQTVIAVPYDMPIIGYGTDHVSNLRLWQSEAVNRFNFKAFNNCEYEEAVKEKNTAEDISSVLYPNDNTEPGKILRLKQQYFFCSASLQDIIKKYKVKHGSDFSKFSSMHAIQLNDTHPVISIAELVRLLCDFEGLSFNEAFDIARKTFAYTNHTIMAEALEKWSKKLMSNVIPKVLKYILLIQKEFENEMKTLGISKDIIDNIAIVQDDTIHMANLAVYASSYTNGVAQIHTDILKNDVLKDWYSIYPERFQNKTNGITQRRWLLLCNRELSSLITRLLGNENWAKNLSELKNLEQFVNDDNVIKEFI
ncbi:MAG: glycogen/starch/alpha-glucan family phosphorylase, partial [Oscillospiraceae bacterium]|nr:glycogen/starch/alpha-glucan family phosphorylase [Oscillospiraceae bacterium]